MHETDRLIVKAVTVGSVCWFTLTMIAVFLGWWMAYEIGVSR